MEAIKNAIGLGSTTTTQQEGREPVSGVTGSGIAGEPYDQGNAEDPTLGGKAPQHTEPYTIGSGLGSNSTSTTTGTTTGLTSSDAVTPNAASATSSTGPAVDPTSSNVGSTNNGPHSSNVANKVDPRVDSDNDKNTSSTVGSSGPIGGSSWMSTALPHRGGNSATTTKETSGTTTQNPSQSYSQQTSAQASGLEDIKSQPPNNLPTNVPSGTSTDFVAPGSAPFATTGTTTDTTTDPMHAHQDIPSEAVGAGVAGDHKPSHALDGSRSSIAPTKPDHTNAPLKPAEKGGEHGVNPSAIPTAGGKKIGEDAYTERKSMQADATDSTVVPPMTTSANTARNTGTAEAVGTQSSSSAATHELEGSSVTSGGSGSEHKEKKGLMEKIKEKVHVHKH